MIARLGPAIEHGGERHEFATERVTIEPFDLRMRPRHALVIDRLAHWYYVPREWIKKVALMDGVYLMNNPFTFQSMEKHSAYCAMMRLGLKVPDTWLVPYKQPPADERFAYTAERYNRPFDLAEIAERIGYPLFMKPFDGGAWVGVSQVRDAHELAARYDESGPAADAPAARRRRLRRVRPLALDRRRDDGHALRARPAAARPLPGRPRLPRRRDRPRGRHDRAHGQRVLPLGVQLLRDADQGRRGPPDRLRERLPGRLADLAALLLPLGDQGAAALDRLLLRDRAPHARRDGPGGLVRDRRLRAGATRRSSRRYRELADDYFEVDAYEEFCDRHLGHVDEAMADYVDSPEFDALLVETVTRAFPPREHEQFVAHYRGLLGAWVADQR